MAALGLVSLHGTTLNVRNSGATGDGATDDTNAIQKLLDGSSPGDTILFPAGTYRLSAPINLQSNRTYEGQGGAVILGAGGWYTFATPWDATSNITITGLVIDGAPIAVQGDDTAANNVQISNCTFQNIITTNNNWTTHYGIFIASGLANSRITNNKFFNILEGGAAPLYDTVAGGIYGKNLRNVIISNNTCDTVNECMYFTSDTSDTYPGVVISNNIGTQVHRNGIEMQLYNTVNIQITGNTFSNFLNPYYNTFGISYAVDLSSSGAVIQNNTLIALPTPPDGTLYGYAIEAWGTNTNVGNNDIEGVWSLGIAIGDSVNMAVTNNSLCGLFAWGYIENEFGPWPGTVIQGNTIAKACSLPPAPTGMALWLDASISVTSNNGRVSAWADRTGSDLRATQSQVGSQPTLMTGSGNPAIRFDGVSSWLSVAFPINGLTGITIFLVSSNAVDSTFGWGVNAAMSWNESVMWGATFLGPFQTNVMYRFGTAQVENAPAYNRPYDIFSTTSLTEMVKDGQTDSLYVNGTLVQSQSGKLPSISGTLDALSLGLGLGQTYFAGDIAEIIIYRGALSDAERNQVETYLMAKYVLP